VILFSVSVKTNLEHLTVLLRPRPAEAARGVLATWMIQLTRPAYRPGLRTHWTVSFDTRAPSYSGRRETRLLLPERRLRAYAPLRAIGLTCRLFPSSVQMRPVFLLSSSATLFLYRRPSIGGVLQQREILHKQEAREGAREASLERMDLAEERVVLYGDAI